MNEKPKGGWEEGEGRRKERKKEKKKEWGLERGLQ